MQTFPAFGGAFRSGLEVLPPPKRTPLDNTGRVENGFTLQRGKLQCNLQLGTKQRLQQLQLLFIDVLTLLQENTNKVVNLWHKRYCTMVTVFFISKHNNKKMSTRTTK